MKFLQKFEEKSCLSRCADSSTKTNKTHSLSHSHSHSHSRSHRHNQSLVQTVQNPGENKTICKGRGQTHRRTLPLYQITVVKIHQNGQEATICHFLDWTGKHRYTVSLKITHCKNSKLKGFLFVKDIPKICPRYV